LHGKPYTHAWGNPGERSYALLEILLSVIFYIAAITYAKLRGRQMKQKQTPAD